MSGIAEAVVRLAARTLPALARDRYREEWLADLTGAHEAGVSRAGVVAGALATAVSIQRTAPEVTGHTLGRLFAHRLRVAGGLLGGAGVLAAGSVVSGSYGSTLTQGAVVVSVAAAVVLVAVVLLGAAGVVALAGAVRVAVESRRMAAAVALVAVPVALGAVFVAAPSVLLGFGVLAGPLALVGLVVLVVVGARGRGILPVGRRLALASGAAGVALATGAVGILHVALWNPLARVPGLTIDEIYAGLAAAGEGTMVRPWLVAWAVVTVLGALVYVVGAVVWRGATTRRLVATGLALVAATAAFGFLPGFAMGMSLADAFLTSGGDAAPSGPLLAILGQAALVAAMLTAFVRPPTPLPPPVAGLARP